MSEKSFSEAADSQQEKPTYEQIQQQLQDAQRESAEQKKLLAAQEQTIESQKKEIHELSYDMVMGVRTRPFFYKDLTKFTEQAFIETLQQDAQQWENMSFDEFTQMILKQDPQKLAHTPLTVFIGDMAYLSLANSIGHTYGDELLKNVGQAVNETMDEFPERFEIFRHGGDETAGILRFSDPEEMQKAIGIFESRVGGRKLTELNAFGLRDSLHVDIGTATTLEALSAFQIFLERIRSVNEMSAANPEDSIDIPADRRFRCFIDMWIGVADERSTLHKAERRIPALQYYRKNYPEVYLNIIDKLRKGAQDITDKELDDLPENNRGFTQEFIIEKRIQKRKNIQDEKIKVLMGDVIAEFVIPGFRARNQTEKRED